MSVWEWDEGSEFCTAGKAFHMAAFMDITATNLGIFFGKLGFWKLKQKSAALQNL